MTDIDYLAHAELFLGRDLDTAMALGSRAFRRAAHALRFAFEHAAPISLHGARLRVGARTYEAGELLNLYSSDSYPLARKS